MVTANNPPATGNFTTNPAAAEVLINVGVASRLSSLFSSATPSVASPARRCGRDGRTACVLSTIGDLNITANQGR